MFATKKEAIDVFKALLSSANVGSDWTYEAAVKVVAEDERFLIALVVAHVCMCHFPSNFKKTNQIQRPENTAREESCVCRVRC